MLSCRPTHCVPVLLTLSALGACAAREVPIVETQGECGAMYSAQVCTWARMQGDSVIDIGAMVPVASIESAPHDAAMAWPPAPVTALALPAAAQARTGLTHMTVFWESMGHPPGPYLTPHFDFHFYTVPQEQRLGMDCADLSKPVELAAGYSLPDVTLPPPMAAMTGTATLTGLCVPQMGMHSLLTSELEGTGLFVKQGRLKIWLTDDARRVPVRMRSKVAIGSVSADLERYESGAQGESRAPR